MSINMEDITETVMKQFSNKCSGYARKIIRKNCINSPNFLSWLFLEISIFIL